ncbi:MAG: hypothetical protein AAGE94_01265 [Acidobacteriota bacterium]
MRLVVANLDAEMRWAGRPTTLRRPLRAALAAWGTLLRVFAEPDDLLWTLAPIDPSRLPTIDGLSRPTLVSGPRSRPGDTPTTLWATTRPWAAEAAVAVAARANDRAFGLDVARRLDLASRGSRMVEDVETLRRHLERPSTEWHDGWIAKAPWSTAGRDRCVGRQATDADAPAVHGLFRRHRRLLVEPLHQRIEDFGAVGAIDDVGRLAPNVSTHRLLTDTRGTFRWIESGGTAVAADIHDTLTKTLQAAAPALSAAGYHGPVGIDAYSHRTPDGDRQLRPLVEINARHTFGTLAHALVRRLVPEVAREPQRRVVLRLGRADECELSIRDTATDTVLLVAPDRDGLGAAWLESS